VSWSDKATVQMVNDLFSIEVLVVLEDVSKVRGVPVYFRRSLVLSHSVGKFSDVST
jgi:hypothetical protein